MMSVRQVKTRGMFFLPIAASQHKSKMKLVSVTEMILSNSLLKGNCTRKTQNWY